MYIRQVRTIVLQEMEQGYVQMARLRGVSDGHIMLHGVLKAAAPTILVLTGMTFAQLMGGSAIIENVFSWPGLGAYAVQAVFARDYPVVQGYVLIMAVFFVLVNLVRRPCSGAHRPASPFGLAPLGFPFGSRCAA